MKENSIERDIHLLESYAGMTHKMNDNQGRPKLDQAIEHILLDYKRVLKENEELKNNTRKNENELEFDIDCDWIALQKMLDESEKSNEYISYKNEKWIKEKYCIPIQKIKEKIRKNEEIIDISNDGDLIHELLQKNKVYEELLESEK